MTTRYECDRCGNVVKEAAKVLVFRQPVTTAEKVDGPDLCHACIQEHQDFLNELKARNADAESEHTHG